MWNEAEIELERVACCRMCSRPLDVCMKEPCSVMKAAHDELKAFEDHLEKQSVNRPIEFWKYWRLMKELFEKR